MSRFSKGSTMVSALPRVTVSAVPIAGARATLSMLEGFRLVHDGVVVEPCSAGQRLLALIAIRGAITRRTAAGLLWPDSTDRRADASLRTTLWRVGRLMPDVVRVERDRLSLALAGTTDVTAGVAWSTRMINEAEVGEEDLVMPFPGAGELLPGWFEDWVLHERERLRQVRLHALERVATRLGARGRYAAAVVAALEVIGMEPLRESAHATLIELHLAQGNVAEALRQYRSLQRLLRSELGVEPSPRLASMVSAIGLRPVRASDGHHHPRYSRGAAT